MKIAIMQPYFFPYIGYFQLINSADIFVLYEHLTFRRRTWISRNQILNHGTNERLMITTQIESQSSFRLISEHKVSSNLYWRKKMLKTLFINYKKAPFFSNIYPVIEDIINYEETNLHDYNVNCIIKISKLLDVKTTIISRDSSHIEIERQLINTYKFDKENLKSGRIFNICAKYGGSSYINPIGGVDLYNKEYFKKNTLDLFFLKTNDDISYSQFYHKFTPHLSIIDVLMHNGINKTKELLNQYKLI